MHFHIHTRNKTIALFRWLIMPYIFLQNVKSLLVRRLKKSVKECLYSRTYYKVKYCLLHASSGNISMTTWHSLCRSETLVLGFFSFCSVFYFMFMSFFYWNFQFTILLCLQKNINIKKRTSTLSLFHRLSSALWLSLDSIMEYILCFDDIQIVINAFEFELYLYSHFIERC